MEENQRKKTEFYPWQLEARRALTDNEGRPLSSVLSAPTGAGKTLVAYLWAGLIDSEGRPIADRTGCDKVIFTAPIKALSNERYMDLLKMGFDVGIETGDFKKNDAAPVICCTQEIPCLEFMRAKRPDVICRDVFCVFPFIVPLLSEFVWECRFFYSSEDILIRHLRCFRVPL